MIPKEERRLPETAAGKTKGAAGFLPFFFLHLIPVPFGLLYT